MSECIAYLRCVEEVGPYGTRRWVPKFSAPNCPSLCIDAKFVAEEALMLKGDPGEAAELREAQKAVASALTSKYKAERELDELKKQLTPPAPSPAPTPAPTPAPSPEEEVPF